MKLKWLACGFLIALFFKTAPAHAAQFSFVSDTITDSRPSTAANHTIVFRIPDAVPASGKIVVAFENSQFLIDPAFDFNDVKLAISTSSPYSGFSDRTLAAAASAGNDGVGIAGTTGPITLTLASGGGIPADAYVKIVLGTGNNAITNPTSTDSYRILLNSYDASGTAIDYGAAMVAILQGIGVDVNENKVNPSVLSNGLPSGTIPSNVSAVLISFNTDFFSTCRYATSSGVSYDAMTNTITHDAAGTLQTALIGNIVKGTVYNIYIRCQDFVGNKNPDDYLISFTAGDPTGTGSGGGTGGGPAAPPGTPSGGGGGGTPYPPGPSLPSLIIRGIAMPNTQISVLEDGAPLSGSGATSDGSGNFSITVPPLPQGTYSFTLLEHDTTGRTISSYTATITVISGTTNSITNILLPPSVSFVTSTIKLGDTTLISGFAPPSSTIEMWATSQGNLQGPLEFTASANIAGAWSYNLNTKGWPQDTYQLKARATLPGWSASNYSNISYLGVGTAPVIRGKGDLNGDGKVNLVDFSILLFHWGENYPAADLNGNGTVDLPDFSILLFNWSG